MSSVNTGEGEADEIVECVHNGNGVYVRKEVKKNRNFVTLIQVCISS